LHIYDEREKKRIGEKEKKGEEREKKRKKNTLRYLLGEKYNFGKGGGGEYDCVENIHLCMFVVVCISLGLSIYKLIAPMYKKP